MHALGPGQRRFLAFDRFALAGRVRLGGGAKGKVVGSYTAHLDTFSRDNLPAPNLHPQVLFSLPELQYPARLNASALLERAARGRFAGKLAVTCGAQRWSYRELLANADRVARVLVEDLGFVPGERVLLHAANTPWTMAVWWGVIRAGGVAVTTMPMLRAGELAEIIARARIAHVFSQPALAEAVEGAREAAGCVRHVVYFGSEPGLARRFQDKAAGFEPAPTAADDVALIAFTSGTTGRPKGCVHYHRDILSMANTFAAHTLRPEADDVFAGTPPFGFTFGLGALVVFPAAAGATIALPEAPGFDALAETIAAEKVTTLFTAPTGYRTLLKTAPAGALAGLKSCVSAGEPLSPATSDAWFAATGVRPIDGIGATEMIHIFISASGREIRPGSTGRAVPGYQACVLGPDDRPLPRGSEGRLAVRGPTGCRYLADEARQRAYVVDGWNVTGDIYRQDEEGYFWFVSRADDIILSAGYNIAAAEVEDALLKHKAVHEAAVVAAPDPDRGQVCKAYVVLHPRADAGSDLAEELQRFVKRTIAPYKYPRLIEFVPELPKTATGKLQRHRLREAK